MLFFKKKKIPLSLFFPEKFIDIHSHLLPGLDDGASDMENSIELILKLRSFGVKNFITTPHVLGNIYPNSSKIIKAKLKEGQKELTKRKIEDVSLRAAAEYMLDEEFCKRLENNDLLTLKDSYILVEMSYFNPPINLFEILFEIQLKGYKPILAHPERYSFYHNDLRNYYKLKKAGCLFQLNLLSLTEQYGRNIQKISSSLLEKNLYDFAASDIHHLTHLELLKNIGTKQNLIKIKHLLYHNRDTFK